MPSIGWTELLIILAIVLLLFGANKLPDLARSMGRSARIFRSEVKEMHNEDAASDSASNADAASGSTQAEIAPAELSQPTASVQTETPAKQPHAQK